MNLTNQFLKKEGKEVVTLTLDRPNAANALSMQLLKELHVHVEALREDSQARVIIIRSAGEKAFCAGADLKERMAMTEEDVREAVKLIGNTIQGISTLPQPVVVAANGLALGGGLELALAADLRVFSEKAQYGLTETSLAIIPGAGGTQRLPRIVGVGKAKELIYTAKRISGKEAEYIGLCEYAVPSSQVYEKAVELATVIAQNGPVAIRAAKQAIDRGLDCAMEDGLKVENNAYQQTINTEDRMEGLNAFKEKRKPRYQGC
ncbi:enoyl-CoA hydratase [Shouchella lehensis]|uniref:Enoyl-CoA hydratase/isomerase n=1 Tax=Shouchella lehensis G1 TaxID=1246626 RepID=A0A060LRL2_9BACI|nr:enoyl-CoA hydratase [Shouchella lehensis]AIC93906.1 enoyl-CoA hydratase/isomerase [Shouchella lehensis G1]